MHENRGGSALFETRTKWIYVKIKSFWRPVLWISRPIDGLRKQWQWRQGWIEQEKKKKKQKEKKQK